MPKKTPEREVPQVNLNFSLKPDSDHIPLNQLLKNMRLVGTGGEANIRIDNGEVKVNGEVEWQKRKKLRVGDEVWINKVTIKILN